MAIKDTKLVEIIVKAAEAKKADNIVTLNIKKVSTIIDYLIITSAGSEPQLRAIEKEIDKSLRCNKIKGFRWEGLLKSGWLLLDLGNIVVHVMKQSERDYYKLEELWGEEAIVYHY